MALNEACQLWIEQRLEEELKNREHTGKSLRAIGRELAKEILKYFEAKVEPETIAKRAERMAATNVATDTTPQDDKESEENKEISKGLTADGKPRQRAKGAGRKPKHKKKEVNQNEDLVRAYESFAEEVKRAKLSQWQIATRDKVLQLINQLLALIDS